jgi:CHASE2 domain-containing sensor protein
VDSERGELSIRYYEYRDPDHPRERRLKQTAEITLSTIEPYTGSPGAEGREPGDMVGIYIVEVPADEALAAATLEYEWVFEADVEQLRTRLGGKAVVVGDLRSGRAPAFPHPDGRMLSATYGYAAGIEALLRGGAIRADPWEAGITASVLAAIVGILIAAVATARIGLRYLLIVGVALLVFFVSVLSYHELAYLVNPLVPLLAMIVACELAVGVNRARQTRLA